MTTEDLQRVLEIVEGQEYFPDTNIGKRQQWVKDEIARKIRDKFASAERLELPTSCSSNRA